MSRPETVHSPVRPGRNSAALLVLALVTGGCSSIHYGSATKTRSGVLKVSCGEDIAASAQHYMALTCTFENRSNRFTTVEVESVGLPARDGVVLSPEDVHDYLVALELQKQHETANRRAFLAGLVILGATASVVGAASGDAGLEAAGDAVVGTAVLTDAVAEAADASRPPPWVYSEEHIAGPAFRVPGGMFVRKNLFVELRGPRRRGRKLGLCMKTHGCIHVEFEPARRASD